MRVMAISDGSTSGGAEIPAEEVIALARELGVDARRLEDWRERGVVPRPRRAGSEGRRPRWLYPPHTSKQLRAAVRWREGTRDFDAIKVALWAEGFPMPLEAVRDSLLLVVDEFTAALAKEVARFTPGGEGALDDPEALEQGLDGYAEELARLRSRQPFKRKGKPRLTLVERQRAFLFGLAPFFGLQQAPEDAGLAERLYGISRGRSGTAGGLLTEPPASYVGVQPISGTEMRRAIESADEAALTYVQGSLETFLKLFPALATVFVPLVPPDSRFQAFIKDALELLSDMPAPMLTVFAAALITNVQRHREVEELTPELIRQFRPEPIVRALFEEFDNKQKETFVKSLTSRNK
jgi:MerR-like DNA binding protein